MMDLIPFSRKSVTNFKKKKIAKKQFRPLDYFITEYEIRKAAKKLKNNKSSSSNKIKSGMIKASINDLMSLYYNFSMEF